MSGDFDKEDSFFAQPYIFKPEYTDKEIGEIDVQQKALIFHQKYLNLCSEDE